tara:strand:- start:4689 stop:4844 length:156 start_codon:yes stop_codon:yes gene_type:complete
MAKKTHKHLQNIPTELNEQVDEELKTGIVPSKTFLINTLLEGWVKGRIQLF